MMILMMILTGLRRAKGEARDGDRVGNGDGDREGKGSQDLQALCWRRVCECWVSGTGGRGSKMEGGKEGRKGGE